MKKLITICMVCLIFMAAGPAMASVTISVPGEANVAFAGQTQSALETYAAPSSGWATVLWNVGGAGNHGNFHNDTADWAGVTRAYSGGYSTGLVAASTIAPFIDVTGWPGIASITATGSWGKGPAYSWGPDGDGGGNTIPHGEYNDFGIAWASAPKGALVGVFLTDADPASVTLSHPLTLPSTLIAGTNDMTTPDLQQSFLIGSSLDNITIPTGATRLFFGFHNGYEWWNNDGDMEVIVTPIPAPGAILLGSIGVGLVGWLRRRRTL